MTMFPALKAGSGRSRALRYQIAKLRVGHQLPRGRPKGPDEEIVPLVRIGLLEPVDAFGQPFIDDLIRTRVEGLPLQAQVGFAASLKAVVDAEVAGGTP